MVVDDEPLARIGVVARLAEHGDFKVIAESSSAEEASEQIKKCRPDLLFLDIQMAGLSGLELLDTLPESSVPAVIFLTAHQQYALDAFRHEALDYLMKPVDDTYFADALNRARRLFSLRTRAELSAHENAALPKGEYIARFTVHSRRKTIFVKSSDIDWIEGLGDYAGLHEGNATHLIRESLSSLERGLDPAVFLRIHRSTIVNANRIRHIERLTNQDSIITLESGVELRGSRTYYASLKKLRSGHS